jgi:NAD(P)-dependent dehydrogenase (short-subunit alcohol dehydrogenase family)
MHKQKPRINYQLKMQSKEIEERAARLLSLEGKVAMVTGSASGIGRGVSIRLAEMGAFIAVLDIDETGGRESAAEIEARGSEAIFLKCDVRSASACRRAVKTTVQRSGKIDILCNCAGIAIRKDVIDLTEEEWDLALDVTLKGIYLLSREVVPHMMRSGGGSIINIGSGWSLKGGPRAASYCAAKGGALNLTRAMAIDHGNHNIRVNCVCPGDVETPMLLSECAQLGEDREAFLREAANRPLARVGTPDDIANAVLFLASPMSSWITGAALVVDGGGLA